MGSQPGQPATAECLRAPSAQVGDTDVARAQSVAQGIRAGVAIVGRVGHLADIHAVEHYRVRLG